MDKKTEFWEVDLPDELLELNTPYSSPRNLEDRLMDVDLPTFAYENEAFPNSPDITEIFSNDFLTVEYKEPMNVANNASKHEEQNPRNRDEILTNFHDAVKVTPQVPIPSNGLPDSKVQQGPKTTKSGSNTFQVQPIYIVFDQFYGNENSDLFHLPSTTLPKGILNGPQMHQRKPTMVKLLTTADLIPTTIHLDGLGKGSSENAKLEASKNQEYNATNPGTADAEDDIGYTILLNEVFDSETQCLHHTHQVQKFLEKTRPRKEVILQKLSKLENDYRAMGDTLKQKIEQNRKLKSLLLDNGINCKFQV